MITMAQRIEQLRTQMSLSRPALAAALGFPRNSLEKFETGRQTPSKEQQEKLASYFGVSVFYLRCESDDPTRQETWMDAAYAQEERAAPAPRREPKPAVPSAPAGEEQGGLFNSLLGSKAFQDVVRNAVLDALRTPEGQDILTQAIRKELSRR